VKPNDFVFAQPNARVASHTVMRLLILGMVACSPAVQRPRPPPRPEPVAEPPIAVGVALERELVSGATSRVDIRAPAGGALVGHCTITYDLWNETWEVERHGVRRSFRDRRAGLSSCVNRAALQRARETALAGRERFELIAELQPLAAGTGLRGHDAIWCGGVDDKLIRP